MRGVLSIPLAQACNRIAEAYGLPFPRQMQPGRSRIERRAISGSISGMASWWTLPSTSTAWSPNNPSRSAQTTHWGTDALAKAVVHHSPLCVKKDGPSGPFYRGGQGMPSPHEW